MRVVVEIAVWTLTVVGVSVAVGLVLGWALGKGLWGVEETDR